MFKCMCRKDVKVFVWQGCVGVCVWGGFICCLCGFVFPGISCVLLMCAAPFLVAVLSPWLAFRWLGLPDVPREPHVHLRCVLPDL